jgi:glycine/D-amino acid oxidase-like deaminating enzyme
LRALRIGGFLGEGRWKGLPVDNFKPSRRAVLATGAMGAVALAPFARALADAPDATSPPLPKVDVAPDRVLREITGLRPFRPSGFVVKSEPLGDKVVVHNYGHGGCGVTLSWGTADMAARLALATPHREAAVIGCGVIGLTTARTLQDRGFKVGIYAKDLPPHTTSNVAAGAFGVTSLVDEAHHTEDITRRIQEATRFAYKYFEGLIGGRYGVRWMDFYMLSASPVELPWEFSITPELFPLATFGPGQHPFPSPYAGRFRTMIAETDVFLPALMDEARERGAQIEVREFADLASLQSIDAPLIVNCTGLGAKALFGDAELTPVKGQLTVLKAQPEVTYAYLDGVLDFYMFSRSDGIFLGGSHGEGVWSTDIDPLRAAQILEGHALIAGGMRA